MNANFKGVEKFILDDNGVIVGLQRDEITRLANKIAGIFDWCECYPETDTEACEQTVIEWFNQKKELINLFVKSPFYNGDYAIEFDKPIHRTFDKDTFKSFISIAKSWELFKFEKKEQRIGTFTYGELTSILNRLSDKITALKDANYYYNNNPLNGLLNEARAERIHFRELIEKFGSDDYESYDGRMYTRGDYDSHWDFVSCMDVIKNHPKQFVDEDMASAINSYIPEFKAKEGQKVSRVVNKLCKMAGITELTNKDLVEVGLGYSNMEDSKNVYNIEFAKFADACNPFETQKHIFISLNPLDYLTMAWGTDWSSCHSTDKNNKHKWSDRSGASYSGCYSSGCESYMLDPSSVVFFILGDNAIERAKEMREPVPRKEMRQMFHIGKEKFIQGRLYPFDQSDKGNYAEPEDYVQYREIVQTLLAELWGVPNLWSNKTNKKYPGICSDNSYQIGTHYHDITHYDNPNVSFLKEYISSPRIDIGADPICPHCGERHTESSNTFCEDCINGDRDTNYCEYHERYESCDGTYVDNYGWVCYDALEGSGDFALCEHCDEWYYIGRYDDGVRSERDERWFCCVSCAEREGYYYVEMADDYISEDDYEYSEIDGEDLPTYDLSYYDLCYAYYEEYETTIARQSSCVRYNGDWYGEDVMVETVDGDMIPEWESVEVVLNEYGDTEIVHRDNHDIVEYNDEYYYSANCVETVDGDLVPEWYACYIDGEWYDQDVCTEIDGEWYKDEDTIYYRGTFYLKKLSVIVDGYWTPLDMSEMEEIDRVVA